MAPQQQLQGHSCTTTSICVLERMLPDWHHDSDGIWTPLLAYTCEENRCPWVNQAGDIEALAQDVADKNAKLARLKSQNGGDPEEKNKAGEEEAAHKMGGKSNLFCCTSRRFRNMDSIFRHSNLRNSSLQQLQLICQGRGHCPAPGSCPTTFRHCRDHPGEESYYVSF
ncbi:hypothetical protein Y1Q_0019717 [Alligator mississippiensis]|uniref:Uncharacterized protein n=1 Tax=Alligator mississippiensis TaxID=8496 RepID=A0A151PFQ8_ALLMI|nr:hypothetical protein Y1Q_0019717 [Alligator mississippiensis]